MMGDGRGALGVEELLHEEMRAGAEERVWRMARGDGGDGVAVLWVEAAKQIQHLTGFGDGLANVAKVVGERLELGSVVGDGEITLI
jgi:hypothetical protein